MGVLTAYDKFIQQALKYGFSLWGTAKTGQKTSYRDGDDGDLEKGYPKAPPRFTDNGDGTITDNATGLMWVQDPSQLGGDWGTPGSPAKKPWTTFLDGCLALNYAGHSDWRLPNSKELFSIADHGRNTPAIDPIFTNATGGSYWTSTTEDDVPTHAWVVVFLLGEVEVKAKTEDSHARPVRLGVPA